MIARTETLDALQLEGNVELAEALYLVETVDDLDVLTATGFVAGLAGQPDRALGMLRSGAVPTAVLVGRVDPALREFLGSEVPEVTVRALPVDSVAGTLGWLPGIARRGWSDDELTAKRATWLRIAAEAMVEVDGSGVEIIEPREPSTSPWPAPLSDAVRIGVLGRFLALVEQQTEADPAAILFDVLTRIGNAVGRWPRFEVSGDNHGANLFVAIVGDTGQGRKGTSAAYPRRLLEIADSEWSGRCCKSGLSSGEGLIWSVRDPGPSGRVDKQGQPILDPGADDKRLLVVETELARTLKAAGRRDNTLAPVLRQAWEGGRLATMTKAPYSASEAHVSIVAHVTRHELRELLKDGDVHGGTVNRLLLVCSRRQRQLPFGGHVDEMALAGIAAELGRTLAAARNVGHVPFTSLAHEVWPAIYAKLQRDEQAVGIGGALLARATVQTRRLALVFALACGSSEVDVKHLDAAVECWRYVRDSVGYVFGSTTGNRIADRIIGELRGMPSGLPKRELHELFGRNISASQIDEALALLHRLQLASGQRIRPKAGSKGGRPTEVWHAIAV